MAIEESRQLIDQRKAYLYELIRRLNSNRNELALISKLPPELLGRIFAFVGASDTHPYGIPDTSPDWWNITYVSQKWRNIALDTPHLWSSPVFYYPTWAKVMLERSKMVDLVVDADCGRIVDPALMKEVFNNHAGRIKEISLRDLTSSFLSSILEGVQPSSLHLRSLHLSNVNWASADDLELPLFPAHLVVHPDGLQQVEIERCSFDWYAQPHHLLTRLVIYDTRNRPLLSEFVTALSSMPDLETLEMISSLPSATGAVKLDLKVHLPKLSLLRLSSTENLFEILNVLNLLIVPYTTTVYISGDESTPLPLTRLSDIGLPFGLFFSCMTGSHKKMSFVRLRLHFANGDGINLSAWRNDQFTPDLSLSLNHPSYETSQFFDEILPRLHLFDLQTLMIDVDFGQGAIRRHFGRSSNIQYVELGSEDAVSEFLDVLTYKPEGYEHLESAYHSVTFPALQSLKFDRLSFDLVVVLDCLMERYERGAELRKLILQNCYCVDEDEVRSLREIVDDVEWDGIVQFPESDSSNSDLFDDDWL